MLRRRPLNVGGEAQIRPLSSPAMLLRWKTEHVRFVFSLQVRRGMQFGMHMLWLLSVRQTRINPFIRSPAKLPCRQALHLKCTISYPCLV